MSQSIYPVPESIKNAALIDNDQYNEMYQKSIDDPQSFWAEHGQRLDWSKPYSKVKNTSFDKGHIAIKWFEDGELNASFNCIDRHLEDKADKIALIWEGDNPDDGENITYQQLHDEVAKLANGLKKLGVKKGDRVAIYMPMTPQAVYAMQACARVGAVHSVVFGGFSPSAIADRIKDSGAKIVITSDEGRRGGNAVPLKANVDEAVAQEGVTSVEHVIVHQLTAGEVEWHAHDVWWHDLVADLPASCEPTPMNAEDPLFILYTSGSTGQPKGVVHTTGGYLVYSSMTHEYVFDLKEDDVYWCSADVGWITGHSYIAYGPLINGCTQVVFEGVPTYPTAGRMGEIVDKHNVTILYTAPTAIRALMAKGDEPTATSQRSSLRVLGSVGEPINPEAWTWYYESIGNSQCPIVDTWWQTETGGIMITPLPGATDMKPGSATRPFFGIAPALFDAQGDTLDGATDGNLVILDSWPSQARTVYGDHERFEQTYFSAYPGVYFTGDGCRRDEDGYYWITGRVDDVLNVSGHRLGTAEIESALVAHEAVAEAAVVGYPHEIKGQGIYVYVTPNEGIEINEALTKEVRNWVRKELSPIASPDMIQWSPGLPKTRSGKIMRRILRKIAANEYQQLGDTSTLADPSVVEELIENRLNR
ncbi:acetate--CoA ligase [Pseudoalteromonas sp. MMG013]|uniref:acetate--CoA ligase n=1 Tax=unclassified Pseudoalteromonas TaxID=194690 RepID=UPI001B39A3F6|nr:MULTISPECIES: acetate--CoA ligase [unclassified Pseudoalteromonas]MBQ4851151.1 acetate--CoA ligase [Pseudoalteromonas sp. MMG012]MBQ4863202.1 acetate--CoA ligase [Pseudoalteromonas sp. MMG013]